MKSSDRDIVLAGEQGVYFFKYLAWDSRFFGCPCYRLESKHSRLTASSDMVSLIKSKLKGAFVTAKINTALDYRVPSIFMEGGFRYIDTEITLEAPPGDLPSQQDSAIRIAGPEPKLSLPCEELGSTFSMTRFHTDPNIKPEKANRLWINYLKNYTIDDHHPMHAALVKDEVAGVVLANIKPTHVMLFFVAVRPEFGSQGIGSLLVRHVIGRYRGRPIRTETQVKNHQAINFYIKNGFKTVRATHTVLHRW